MRKTRGVHESEQKVVEKLQRRVRDEADITGLSGKKRRGIPTKGGVEPTQPLKSSTAERWVTPRKNGRVARRGVVKKDKRRDRKKIIITAIISMKRGKGTAQPQCKKSAENAQDHLPPRIQTSRGANC